MTRGRLFLISLATLIVTLGLGFAWGASGRWTVETALEDSRQEMDLVVARSALLEAIRVATLSGPRSPAR
ncbi:MAG: hypothetical protein M3541_20915 [Acidobacteriota bacterium]|nr:hypothetical protein [Acidobacteriota bacterium]MDQ3421198.1 hypothetical protein [Acidobacteriota bacterium]